MDEQECEMCGVVLTSSEGSLYCNSKTCCDHGKEVEPEEN